MNAAGENVGRVASFDTNGRFITRRYWPFAYTALPPASAPAIAAIPGAEATGKAVYASGQYRLVMKRALVSKDATRPTFTPKAFMPVAFQAWDGGAGETGARMSLTSWYYLRLEEPQSSRRFVIPPVVAILTLAVMLLVVRVANRRA